MNMSLRFMPEELLGEDPPAVRAAQRRNLDRMLDEDFDTLLFAHAAAVLSGGYGLPRDFLAGCK
jgi:hypothetical protein